MNVPVSCGGISVNPGDIILADPDGVICIPRKDAAKVLEDAKKFQAADEGKLIKTREGTSTALGSIKLWKPRSSRSSMPCTSRKPLLCGCEKYKR